MLRLLRATVVVTVIAGLAGCHRKTDEINRNQQRYDVVTESAGGTVSSTVGAPGETATAPGTTVTATAADTTTNFTVGTATSASATTESDGSLADTLPPIAGASPVPRPPATDASRISARTRRRSDQPSHSQADNPVTAPPESPAQPASESDTSKPPATDTTGTSPQR